MKIAILNQKGGVGKTTATVLLAYALGTAGKRVGVLDRDPQETATRWLEVAKGDGVEIATARGFYDITLIDTPPSLKHPGVTKSIDEADRAILVCSTSPADVWSTQGAVKLIQERRPDLHPALLFSRYAPHTGFGKAREDYAEKLGLQAFKTAIPERQSIQRAVVWGYRALTSAERENIASLAIEVLTLQP